MTFLFLTALVIATITIALISMPSISYAKSGLTIVLKFKYSKVADSHPEYYDKVRLTIGKYFNEYFNFKKMKFPSSIKVTGLKIPEGTKFEVHLNNPDTDDGSQIDMKNTKCKCKEVGTIQVP
jgi:hypothetical protein